MTHDWTTPAARNNAEWCDAVCRAHGRPGEFLDHAWINRHETPQFYPNVVTLSGAERSAAQVEHIRRLVAAGISGDWAVKDSFGALDLTPLGFRVLFEAQWIYRPVSRKRPEPSFADVQWAKVESSSDLADWEAAWRGDSAGATPEPAARIFMPALLADEDIAVIGACRNHRVVAGAIASRAVDVVGVSNLFVPAVDGEHFRAGCIAAVIDAFPDMALVGYESGADLAGSLALGFESVGPLRVWVHGTN